MNDLFSEKRTKFSIGYVIVALLVLSLIRSFVASAFLAPSTEISYSEFKTALRAGEIESVTVSEDQITGAFKQAAEGEEPAAGTSAELGRRRHPALWPIPGIGRDFSDRPRRRPGPHR